jgi:hypothetical protein
MGTDILIFTHKGRILKLNSHENPLLNISSPYSNLDSMTNHKTNSEGTEVASINVNNSRDLVNTTITLYSYFNDSISTNLSVQLHPNYYYETIHIPIRSGRVSASDKD